METQGLEAKANGVDEAEMGSLERKLRVYLLVLQHVFFFFF